MARERLSGETGVTMIEVLVTLVIVTIGLVGTMEAFIVADKANLKAQQTQAISTAAEESLEQLRAMPYANLALSGLPTHTGDGNATTDKTGDPSDPDYWVSGANLLIPNSFGQELGGLLTGVATTGEVLISGGTINPGPVTVASDGFTVTIYRFVSWVNDSCVFGLLGDLCPGTEDAKRITVAAVLAGSSGQTTKPFWLSSIVANPDSGVAL